MKVYAIDGSVLAITGYWLEVFDTPVMVYNLEVDGFHTYFVGEFGVWVHNYNGKTIIKENGMTIESYYPNDHDGPAHLHINGGGRPTKIGHQGLSVSGQPDLSPKQASV